VGGFLLNSSGATITLPTVGQVVQGTNVYTIPAGFSLLALPEPLAGQALDSTNVNFPAVSGVDSALLWNGANFETVSYFDCSAAPGHGGWYLGQTWEDTNSALWANAGGGFFIHHTGAPLMWTNVFQVQ
jgi:hypothetical protein